MGMNDLLGLNSDTNGRNTGFIPFFGQKIQGLFKDTFPIFSRTPFSAKKSLESVFFGSFCFILKVFLCLLLLDTWEWCVRTLGTASFPGFSPTRPAERARERPWKTLVTWLQNKINSEGAVLCLTFFCLVYSQRSRRAGRREPWERGCPGNSQNNSLNLVCPRFKRETEGGVHLVCGQLDYGKQYQFLLRGSNVYIVLKRP